MIVVIVQMWPGGDKDRAYELAKMEIANDGTGTAETGNYEGILFAEYTSGRKGRIVNFRRQRQSVWSLIGAFLKLWGHTKHSPKDMSKE